MVSRALAACVSQGAAAAAGGMEGAPCESLVLLARELQCALCDCFFQQPVSLPCAHVFCTRCIRNALEGVGVFKNECPKCKQPAFVRDLIINTKVANVTDLLRGLVDVSQLPPLPASGGAAAGARGSGGRKRATPAPAVPTKRLCADKMSSDAASPPAASGSASRDSGAAAAGLAAWAAHQRTLGTPDSSEAAALAVDAEDIRAGLAAVQSRLRQLEAAKAGRDAGGGAPGPARDDHAASVGGGAADDSEGTAGQADAGTHPSLAQFSLTELRQICRTLYGDARGSQATLRRKLAGADLAFIAELRADMARERSQHAAQHAGAAPEPDAASRGQSPDESGAGGAARWT